MMRLSEPTFNFEQALDQCCQGITGNKKLLEAIISNREDLINEDTKYLAAAQNGDLYLIPPINSEEDDPEVINDLKKSDLIKIYEQYFAPEKKPSRKIYDSLLNSAKDQCPFCGGIGTPRNLDHFLPKAHFPQFSFSPHNLVPICRDCNMDEKSASFAKEAEKQIIQPYLDKDIFFQEQWIFAQYHTGHNDEPGAFEYYVNAPEEWDDTDKERAHTHFKDFNLAKRYATKAATLLGTTLRQIENLQQAGLSNEEIKTTILSPGVQEAPFVNHWQRGMYQALIEQL